MSDEDLVNAVWERREMAKASGDPLELAYAELAFKGLALAGTVPQRLLWAGVESAMGEELLAELAELEEGEDL